MIVQLLFLYNDR